MAKTTWYPVFLPASATALKRHDFYSAKTKVSQRRLTACYNKGMVMPLTPGNLGWTVGVSLRMPIWRINEEIFRTLRPTQ